MTQVIGKKLRLMNVPVAKEQDVVQQLVITPEGRVRKKEVSNSQGTNYVFMFRVGSVSNPNPGAPPLVAEHYHTVGLTPEDVTYLLSSPGQTVVQKRSNTVNEHFHDVTFYYDARSNTFAVANITSASDIEHSAQLIAINTPNQPNGYTGNIQIADGPALIFENGILSYTIDPF